MPTLLETQHALCAALLGPQALEPDSPALAPGVPMSGAGLPAADAALALDPAGLAVYRNTCRHTLVKALALSFPAVERLVGAEFFEGMAHAFIERHLPTSACLDDYGAELPAFLASFGPAASVPYLADVARLEWAVNHALHAEDVDALDLARLSSLGESALAHLTFTPHPSLTLLALEFPADAIWRAVIRRDEAAMASIDLACGPVHLLIERDAEGVQVRRLREDAWRFTRRLAEGLPLGVALRPGTDTAVADLVAGVEADAVAGAGIGNAPAASAAQADTLAPLHTVLADHLANGRFVRARCIAPAPACA